MVCTEAALLMMTEASVYAWVCGEMVYCRGGVFSLEAICCGHVFASRAACFSIVDPSYTERPVLCSAILRLPSLRIRRVPGVLLLAHPFRFVSALPLCCHCSSCPAEIALSVHFLFCTRCL